MDDLQRIIIEARHRLADPFLTTSERADLVSRIEAAEKRLAHLEEPRRIIVLVTYLDGHRKVFDLEEGRHSALFLERLSRDRRVDRVTYDRVQSDHVVFQHSLQGGRAWCRLDYFHNGRRADA